MVRSFVFFLLLVIVFLSGIIIGSDSDKNIETNIMQHESMSDGSEIESESEHFLLIDQSDSKNDKDLFDNRPQNHITQKLAAFLEKIVKGLYEIIIEILYQISSLFF